MHGGHVTLVARAVHRRQWMANRLSQRFRSAKQPGGSIGALPSTSNCGDPLQAIGDVSDIALFPTQYQALHEARCGLHEIALCQSKLSHTQPHLGYATPDPQMLE